MQGSFGVEPQVVTAVWGLESFYGERQGTVPVVSALATLAYDGRRGAFFEEQLVAALRILQNGDVTPERMTGSWAGAMGHTQFIPTSFLAYAVDFNGDGRRDIWSDDPADALASAAAYLQRSGWRPGAPWGMEVRLPAGFSGPVGQGRRGRASAWAAAGVRDMDGRAVPDHGPAAILVPQPGGPAFMVFPNFRVILRYNNSENYAIGVGHLSDRLAGGPPVRGGFPAGRGGADDRGPARAAAAADRGGVRHGRRGRGDRRQHPRGDRGLSGAGRAAGDRRAVAGAAGGAAVSGISRRGQV